MRVRWCVPGLQALVVPWDLSILWAGGWRVVHCLYLPLGVCPHPSFSVHTGTWPGLLTWSAAPALSSSLGDADSILPKAWVLLWNHITGVACTHCEIGRNIILSTFAS